MSASPRFPPPAILLAAGLGTRLRPITQTLPKPLVPVAGRPLIDRVLANALAEGVGSFAINLHYRPEPMRAHVDMLQERHPGRRFLLSDETAALLDTGGGARAAAKRLGDADPVLVMNTDAFWPEGSDAPLARMARKFAAADAGIVLLCAQPHRALGFRRSHDFCLDPLGRITNDRGAPVIYAGVALVARAALDALPEGPVSLLRAFDAAMARETLFGVVLDAPWLHVGDPEGLAQAERFLAAR